MKIKKNLLAAFTVFLSMLVLVSAIAIAQTSPAPGVKQSGTVTPGNVTSWAANKTVQDSGVPVSSIHGIPTPGTTAAATTRGLPSNQWTGLYVFGDAGSYNNQFLPANNGWGGLVSRHMGAGIQYYVENNFSSFDCRIVDRQIVPNLNPRSSDNTLSAWLPTLADTLFGAGVYVPHETDTLSCRLGGLTWASIPDIDKTYFQNSTACTTSGPWSTDNHYTYPAGITSQTNGSTASCAIITHTTNAPIYLWYRMISNNGGTFTYSLDGGSTIGTVATQGTNNFDFPCSGQACSTMGAVRIPSTGAAGSHSIRVSVTSTTGSTNTVVPLGLGTPPGGAYSAKAPAIVIGGQIGGNSNQYPAATTAFNTDIQNQALQLAGDGLGVVFANVQAPIYFNPSTDYYSNGNINEIGQEHVSQAFTGVIQPVRNASNQVNPMDFGASANTMYFPVSYTGGIAFGAHMTQGSPNLVITNYTPQPGTASQFGGGDIGKRACVYGGSEGDVGPCSCVINISGNALVLQNNAAVTIGSGNGRSVKLGGYPTNPNDPTTCADDTIPLELGGQAAILNGGEEFLPTNSMGHNVVIPQNVHISGNNTGDYYGSSGTGPDTSPQGATVFYPGNTSFPSDSETGFLVGPSNNHSRYSNFVCQGTDWPTDAYTTNSACIGYTTNSPGNSNQILIDHVAYASNIVDTGEVFGYDYGVNFLATVTSNGDGQTSTMHVLQMTSTNLLAAYGGPSTDFLALNRTATCSTCGSGTITITSVPPSLGNTNTGDYQINKSLTISTSISFFSPPTQGVMELRDDSNTHLYSVLSYNGQFSDTEIKDPIMTAGFASYGIHANNNGNNAGCQIRLSDGRSEEIGNAAFYANACDLDITGHNFDFNAGYNIQSVGASTINVNAGSMHAGDHCGGNIMVRIDGSNARINVSGVALYTNDFGGCGGTTSYLFGTSTGASPTLVSVYGGTQGIEFNGAPVITGLYNWGTFGGTAPPYHQDFPGYPYIDTMVVPTISGLGAVTTSEIGGINSGSFLSGVTSSLGVLTLSGLPAAPNSWDCSAKDVTNPSACSLTATTSTSCALNCSTTSGDKMFYSGKAQ